MLSCLNRDEERDRERDRDREERDRERDRDRDRERDRDRDAEDEEDVYERKKMERKLREKEAAYQEVNKLINFCFSIKLK